MYYLIQKNVFQDPRYDEIFKVVKELNLPYEEFTFIPNSTEITIQTNRTDIFVYGSVKLAKIAAKFNWTPGSFYGGNHEFELYAKGFGAHTINFASRICTISEGIDWSDNPSLFIKPSKDAKVFTGKVFNQPEWEDFVHESLSKSTDTHISESTLIQISKPYQLIKEARIWIVNNTIVTSSYYRFHGDVTFEATVAEDGLAFAQEMANLYTVADAYVMDIALTYDGWKIMEVNCINSAGFYNADVKAIITALEKFYN